MLSNDSYTQSQLGLLPNLNASSSYGINTGKNIDPTSNLFVNQTIRSGNFSLSTNVTLFSGFSKINQMRKAYFDFMASRYSTEQVVNDISLSVATAYLQILFAQENFLNTEANEKLSQEQVDRTTQLVDAGVNSITCRSIQIWKQTQLRLRVRIFAQHCAQLRLL